MKDQALNHLMDITEALDEEGINDHDNELGELYDMIKDHKDNYDDVIGRLEEIEREAGLDL